MPHRLPPELRALFNASRSIAEITDLKEIVSIRDLAARYQVETAWLGLETHNLAAEFKLRAERRAGQLLRSIMKHGGDRKSAVHSQTLKLADLGIDHNRSARWQREASVPDDLFEEYVAAAKEYGKPITARGLLRLEQTLAHKRPDRKPQSSSGS
jgi:hypothetical protein